MRRVLALDIDETICDTRRYWFTELSSRFGAPRDGSIDDLIAHYEYTSRVTEWQTPEALAWLHKERLDETLHREVLRPIPGAIEGAHTVHERFDIVYMTMRSDTLVDATRAWISSHGFPQGEVVASPPYLFDNERPLWKGRELMQRHPDVVGLVDDHPSVAKGIPLGYRGKLFLLGQSVAPRDDIHIVPCKDWSQVTQEVALAFPRERTL